MITPIVDVLSDKKVHFVSKADFEKMIEENKFFEHGHYGGHYYGSSRCAGPMDGQSTMASSVSSTAVHVTSLLTPFYVDFIVVYEFMKDAE
jgi:hypothetical protein